MPYQVIPKWDTARLAANMVYCATPRTRGRTQGIYDVNAVAWEK